MLTEQDVIDIRATLNEGVSTYLVAAAYGVARTTIRKIRDHETWTHI